MTETAPAGRCRCRLRNQPGWRSTVKQAGALFKVTASSLYEQPSLLPAHESIQTVTGLVELYGVLHGQRPSWLTGTV